MKTFSICAFLMLATTMITAQVIDQTNKNITGFNRIQTSSGGWMDIQLIGSGSSFKIHDKTTGNNWVKWSAGNSFTEFLKDVEINANNPVLLLRHASNANNVNGDIDFRTPNSVVYGKIRFTREESPNASLKFFTRNSTGENEVLKLTAQGDMELKAKNPTFLLQNTLGDDNTQADIDFRTANSGVYGRIRFVREDSPNSRIAFYTRNSAGENEVMRIKSNGSVGIGTFETGSHELAVNGSIGAREITVEAGTWSDFVFYDDYQLPTLEEVENHILEKGYLKDIPSAKEVEENGIKLGEMNAKLLQKIEELTLYTIQQEKKLKQQAEEIEKLRMLSERFLELEELVKGNRN